MRLPPVRNLIEGTPDVTSPTSNTPDSAPEGAPADQAPPGPTSTNPDADGNLTGKPTGSDVDRARAGVEAGSPLHELLTELEQLRFLDQARASEESLELELLAAEEHADAASNGGGDELLDDLGPRFLLKALGRLVTNVGRVAAALEQGQQDALLLFNPDGSAGVTVCSTQRKAAILKALQGHQVPPTPMHQLVRLTARAVALLEAREPASAPDAPAGVRVEGVRLAFDEAPPQLLEQLEGLGGAVVAGSRGGGGQAAREVVATFDALDVDSIAGALQAVPGTLYHRQLDGSTWAKVDNVATWLAGLDLGEDRVARIKEPSA